MKQLDVSDSNTPLPAEDDEDARARDEARKRRRERAWHVAATQMAAPSTRRWRRARTFDSPS